MGKSYQHLLFIDKIGGIPSIVELKAKITSFTLPYLLFTIL
jgi:hypothetical protein